MGKVDLSVELCGRKLKSPLVLASGVLGTDAQILFRVAKTTIGAVTTKSCGGSVKYHCVKFLRADG